MKRRLLFGGAVCLAVVALGWIAAWYWIAGSIRERVENWAEARRAEGLTVQHAGLTVEGFPAAWRVRIADPVLKGAGAADWSWSGDALETQFTPLNYRDVALRFAGEHRVAAGEGSLAGSWRVSAERPDGRILIHSNGRLDRLELDFGGATLVRLPDERRFQATQLRGAVALPATVPADHRNESLGVALLIDTLSPVDPPVAGFGTTLSSLKLDLVAKGPLPRGRFAESLRAWRDDGGTVEFTHASLLWGPVNAEANGTLTLDAQDRPLGAFAARWRGYNETIDALQAAGQIPPWPAAGAKVALNAIARQQPDGSKQIELPITLQDGRVFVAGFPLMRLQPLKLD